MSKIRYDFFKNALRLTKIDNHPMIVQRCPRKDRHHAPVMPMHRLQRSIWKRNTMRRAKSRLHRNRIHYETAFLFIPHPCRSIAAPQNSIAEPLSGREHAPGASN